jgi:hypothetical protein
MPRFQLLLLLILLAVVPPCCSGQRSQKFEDWHSRDLRGNPTGVMANLQTRDKRSRYHAGEIVKLDLIFTSRSDDLYTVETADVSGDEVFLQRSSSREPRRLIDRHGVVCCSSAPQTLSTSPTEISTHIYLRLEPGDYSLFVKTKRVCRGKLIAGHYGEGPMLTSGVLQLTIVPDEN